MNIPSDSIDRNKIEAIKQQIAQQARMGSTLMRAGVYTPVAQREGLTDVSSLGHQDSLSTQGFGNSKFDNNFTLDNNLNVEAGRWENQGTLNAIINGLIGRYSSKALTTAASSFGELYSGLLAPVAGVISAINKGSLQEGKNSFLDFFFENDVKSTIQDWDKQASDYFTNYRSKAQQEASTWSMEHLFSNKMFEEIGDLFGFASGAYLSGLGTTGITKLMGATPGLGTSLISSAIASLGEAGIEAHHAGDDYRKQQWSNYLESLKLEEAKIRLNPNISEIEKNLKLNELNNKKQETLGAIQDQSKKIAGLTYAANMAILMPSNLMAYGKAWTNGNIHQAIFNLNRQMDKLDNDLAKGLISKIDYEAAYKKLGLSKSKLHERLNSFSDDLILRGELGNNGRYEATKSMVERSLSLATNPLREGSEEFSQAVVSQAPTDYYSKSLDSLYKSGFNHEAETDFLGLANSYWESLKSNLQNPDSWYEFTLGAALGISGTLGFQKNNDGKYRLSLVGNIVSEYKDMKEKHEEVQQRLNTINSYLERPEIQQIIKRGISQVALNNEKADLLAEGNTDEFMEKSHTDELLTITQFAKSGLLNDLISHYTSMGNMSDADINKLIDDTTTKKDDGTFEGPYVNDLGNRMTTDEVRKLLKNKSKDSLEVIDAYRNHVEDIISMSDPSTDIEDITDLAFIKTKRDFWKKELFSTPLPHQTNDTLFKNINDFLLLQSNIKAKINNPYILGIVENKNSINEEDRTAYKELDKIAKAFEKSFKILGLDITKEEDFLQGLANLRDPDRVNSHNMMVEFKAKQMSDEEAEKYRKENYLDIFDTTNLAEMAFKLSLAEIRGKWRHVNKTHFPLDYSRNADKRNNARVKRERRKNNEILKGQESLLFQRQLNNLNYYANMQISLENSFFTELEVMSALSKIRQERSKAEQDIVSSEVVDLITKELNSRINNNTLNTLLSTPQGREELKATIRNIVNEKLPEEDAEKIASSILDTLISNNPEVSDNIANQHEKELLTQYSATLNKLLKGLLEQSLQKGGMSDFSKEVLETALNMINDDFNFFADDYIVEASGGYYKGLKDIIKDKESLTDYFKIIGITKEDKIKLGFPEAISKIVDQFFSIKNGQNIQDSTVKRAVEDKAKQGQEDKTDNKGSTKRVKIKDDTPPTDGKGSKPVRLGSGYIGSGVFEFLIDPLNRGEYEKTANSDKYKHLAKAIELIEEGSMNLALGRYKIGDKIRFARKDGENNIIYITDSNGIPINILNIENIKVEGTSEAIINSLPVSESTYDYKGNTMRYIEVGGSPIETSISHINNGSLYRLREANLTEGLMDNMPILVSIDNDLGLSETKVYGKTIDSSKIINYDPTTLSDGTAYTLIPSADGRYILIPLKTMIFNDDASTHNRTAEIKNRIEQSVRDALSRDLLKDDLEANEWLKELREFLHIPQDLSIVYDSNSNRINIRSTQITSFDNSKGMGYNTSYRDNNIDITLENNDPTTASTAILEVLKSLNLSYKVARNSPFNSSVVYHNLGRNTTVNSGIILDPIISVDGDIKTEKSNYKPKTHERYSPTESPDGIIEDTTLGGLPIRIEWGEDFNKSTITIVNPHGKDKEVTNIGIKTAILALINYHSGNFSSRYIKHTPSGNYLYVNKGISLEYNPNTKEFKRIRDNGDIIMERAGDIKDLDLKELSDKHNANFTTQVEEDSYIVRSKDGSVRTYPRVTVKTTEVVTKGLDDTSDVVLPASVNVNPNTSKGTPNKEMEAFLNPDKSKYASNRAKGKAIDHLFRDLLPSVLEIYHSFEHTDFLSENYFDEHEFVGKIYELVESRYSTTLTNSFKNNLVNVLNEFFKDFPISKGDKIFTGELLLMDDVNNIAGTPDIIIYNPELGTVSILDIKTSSKKYKPNHSGIFNMMENTQLLAYARLLGDTLGIDHTKINKYIFRVAMEVASPLKDSELNTETVLKKASVLTAGFTDGSTIRRIGNSSPNVAGYLFDNNPNNNGSTGTEEIFGTSDDVTAGYDLGQSGDDINDLVAQELSTLGEIEFTPTVDTDNSNDNNSKPSGAPVFRVSDNYTEFVSELYKQENHEVLSRLLKEINSEFEQVTNMIDLIMYIQDYTEEFEEYYNRCFK